MARISDKELQNRFAKLSLLSLDVDGVLSDGKLYYGEEGLQLKCFNVRDGYGIRAVQNKGVEVVLISGRDDPQTTQRAQELNISHVVVNCDDKAEALRALCERVSCTPEESAHMGDDVPDIAAMNLVGVAAAPADAHASVIECAHWVSGYLGGGGAVRELCDLIVAARS